MYVCNSFFKRELLHTLWEDICDIWHRIWIGKETAASYFLEGKCVRLVTKNVSYIHGISDQRSLLPFYRFVLLPVVPFPPGDVPLPHTAVWRRAHGDRWQQSGGDAHGDSDRQHVQTGHLGDAVVFHEDWGGGGILVRHHCECWKTPSWTPIVFGFNSIPFSFGALLWSAVRRCQ